MMCSSQIPYYFPVVAFFKKTFEQSLWSVFVWMYFVFKSPGWDLSSLVWGNICVAPFGYGVTCCTLEGLNSNRPRWYPSDVVPPSVLLRIASFVNQPNYRSFTSLCIWLPGRSCAGALVLLPKHRCSRSFVLFILLLCQACLILSSNFIFLSLSGNTNAARHYRKQQSWIQCC